VNSFILHHAVRAILPVMILFALYLLLRGHDAPGGGFVAGLVTAAAVILNSLATGWSRVSSGQPRIQWGVSLGLAIAIAVGLISTVMGEGFLRHYHSEIGTLHVSTTLLFDIGVYLVVLGSVVTMLATFAKEER
jgi:multicomponent Na+:H+ antiporter subunit B